MSITLLTGIIITVTLIVLLFAGVPIAVALGISSILAVLPTLDFGAAVLTATQRIFSGISIFTLLAIPFFILAGNIMNRGGIAIRLINFARMMTGRVPGSLAHTNVVANMLFGAVSGSGIAAASAMGSIIGPVEKEEGYDECFSAAVNIATAPTGLLIPPSNALITYSLVSGGTSVAALFMGGYIPGILWGISCMIVAFIYAKKRGYTNKQKLTLKDAVKITWQAVPSILLIVVVIGGIIGGVFTATEGSAIAVVYSLILSLCIYRTIRLKDLKEILLESAKMTGIIIFLVGTSNIMGWVMAFTGLPSAISAGLLGISSNKVVILIFINLLLLFVGTFMDITPAVLIFTPILLPICQSYGMSALQFGIMIVFNLCIGTITPPVGSILFVGVKVAKKNLEEVIKPLLPYYMAIFIVLIMVTFIPAISIWLPGIAGY